MSKAERQHPLLVHVEVLFHVDKKGSRQLAATQLDF